MTNAKFALLALTLIPAFALTSAPAQQATDTAQDMQASDVIDADRLAAAARLIDLLLPPERRVETMGAMVSAQIQNMFSGLMNQPRLKERFDSEPAVRPVFERFMARQRDLALTDMNDNLPGLVEAMSQAYARRFTLSQIADLTTFFSTASGQIYIEQSTTIMTDPAIAAWQTRSMASSFARMPDEMARLQRELEAATIKGNNDGD